MYQEVISARNINKQTRRQRNEEEHYLTQMVREALSHEEHGAEMWRKYRGRSEPRSREEGPGQQEQ